LEYAASIFSSLPVGRLSAMSIKRFRLGGKGGFAELLGAATA